MSSRYMMILGLLLISISDAHLQTDSALQQPSINDSTRNNISLPNYESVKTDNYKYDNLFVKYQTFIGALIGSFSAGFIAWYSVRTSHKKSLERDIIIAEERKRIRDAQYCGNLYAIFVTLGNHDQAVQRILQTIDLIIAELKSKNILLQVMPPGLPLEYFKVCLTQMLGYEQYHTKIGGIAISYLHSAEDLNAYLNLSLLNEMVEHMKYEDPKLIGAVGYFDNLKNHMGLLSEGSDKLKQNILEELKKYPNINMITEVAEGDNQKSA